MNLCKHLVILSILSLGTFAMHAEPKEVLYVQIVEDNITLDRLEQERVALEKIISMGIETTSEDRDLEAELIAICVKIIELQRKDNESMKNDIDWRKRDVKNQRKWHREDVKKARIQGGTVVAVCSLLTVVSGYFTWDYLLKKFASAN